MFYERIAGLEREHASFAIATVVARRAPVSSHLGDRALIFADGHMEGFVGGSCARDIVRRHALGAIRSRAPVLLQIRPDVRETADAPLDDGPATSAERVTIPMSCASEGAVDVYIEPRVPLRRLLVIGFTPVAEALARIAATLDYSVVRVVIDDELRDLAADAPQSDVDGTRAVRAIELKELPAFLDALDAPAQRDLVAVVASQGHYDEIALEVLLARPMAFTGLLASRRRAATVFGVLAQQGIPAERIATLENPVGLDIGARSPGEVAISILAQIIARGDAALGSRQLTDTAATAGSRQLVTTAATAVDPVCGMEVEPAGNLYPAERAGEAYYFCSAHCRAAFAADPDRYRLELGSA